MSHRKWVLDWLAGGHLPNDQLSRALNAAQVYPAAQAWRQFIDRLLLWTGGLALSVALIFFVAYNWTEMGRWAKFAMLEAALILTIVGYWRWALRPVVASVMLMMATLGLGALLAYFGQTYQTGADPWQLFLYWALLMAPWAIAGRAGVLWLFLIALLNLTATLYVHTFRGILWFFPDVEQGLLWLFLGLNGTAWCLWELASLVFRWQPDRWAVRVLAVATGTPLTILTIAHLYDDAASLSLWIWLAWIPAVYSIYRYRLKDLFMLAGGCLSGIVVVTAFLSRHLLYNNGGDLFLLMALLVIGMGAGSATWLRNIHREWSSHDA
ncbi:MAG: DUF2157 domain-containing protein [Hahellaceae bacterium]|jgi:uncharacterized membrane protein|nr:DUF2157 domain-containing protein [Hahellaceae bacterium]